MDAITQETKNRYDKLASQLVELGLTTFEAHYFRNLKTPDGKQQDLDAVFFSPAFQNQLKSRQRWIQKQKERGYSGTKITTALERGFRSGEINPISFLKEEYQRGMRSKSDFQDNLQEVEKAKVNEWSKRHFGTIYKR